MGRPWPGLGGGLSSVQGIVLAEWAAPGRGWAAVCPLFRGWCWLSGPLLAGAGRRFVLCSGDGVGWVGRPWPGLGGGLSSVQGIVLAGWAAPGRGWAAVCPLFRGWCWLSRLGCPWPGLGGGLSSVQGMVLAEWAAPGRGWAAVCPLFRGWCWLSGPPLAGAGRRFVLCSGDGVG